MHQRSLATVAALFAACALATTAQATEPPKGDTGKPAPPKASPAPAPKPTEPPHASPPAPTPAPTPAPAPKNTEPPHASPPAPTPAPTPAPAPAPTPAPKSAPAPAPVSTSTSAWDSWLSAKPVPTSFPAGVAFNNNTADAATGDRKAYFVGRTDVTTSQGKNAEQHSASGAVRLSADLSAQTISGQMGGFTSSTAATATALNAMNLTMSGSYDAAGHITGTTAAAGQSVGKVTGTLTTTLAQGTWTLVKNDFSANATFRAGRVNAPGH